MDHYAETAKAARDATEHLEHEVAGHAGAEQAKEISRLVAESDRRFREEVWPAIQRDDRARMPELHEQTEHPVQEVVALNTTAQPGARGGERPRATGGRRDPRHGTARRDRVLRARDRRSRRRGVLPDAVDLAAGRRAPRRRRRDRQRRSRCARRPARRRRARRSRAGVRSDGRRSRSTPDRAARSAPARVDRPGRVGRRTRDQQSARRDPRLRDAVAARGTTRGSRRAADHRGRSPPVPRDRRGPARSRPAGAPRSIGGGPRRGRARGRGAARRDGTHRRRRDPVSRDARFRKWWPTRARSARSRSTCSRTPSRPYASRGPRRRSSRSRGASATAAPCSRSTITARGSHPRRWRACSSRSSRRARRVTASGSPSRGRSRAHTAATSSSKPRPERRRDARLAVAADRGVPKASGRMKARVLVCDDKENFTKLFRRILPEDRYDVTTAEDGARALALVAAGDFDVIVSDIRMPGADGLAVLREARSRDQDVEVILMTAYATVPAAVDAIREGAYDYLAKPFEPDEALLVVDRALERRRLRQQARDLRRALEGIHRIDNLVARSPAMAAVVALVRRAAASGCDRADHRRERDRQGGGRARDPQHGRPPDGSVRRRQLRRDPREPDRERAVRSRQGQLHRRDDANTAACSKRPTAARSSSTRSPTCRSRCRSSSTASSRSARCAGSERAEELARRRPRDRGDERRSQGARGGGSVPRGSLLPDQRAPRSSCRRCAIAARTSPRSRRSCSSVTARGARSDPRASPRRRCPRS